ncbi:hypothetical protein MKW94_029546 [Papaver nudicaule]|uniref:DUF155 domain-containing protein n=1 Tax=Papaver nudicaule TaxID=74823 RepID=A0AA41VEI4_PAPNU|nr:hypothetical protein [Papaver nudicaule]
MSKLSRIINKQLFNTILSSSSSLKSSPVKLFNITKPPFKNPNFLSPLLNFSRIPAPKQSFLFPRTRVINLCFTSNPRSICSSSSLHMKLEVNQTSSAEVAEKGLMEKDNLWVSIPVRAYYKFRGIDLKGLMAENQANLIPHTSEKNYAVLKFSNAASQTPSPDSDAKLSGSSHSYMVVFPYGSTVMFNMLDDQVDGYLKIIERHASGLAETAKDGASFQNYHIKYEVKENSNWPMGMQGGQGYLMLQHLDMDSIHVISSVLGQSVALDFYIRKVDGVIAAFTELPRGRTIRSCIMRKKRMSQLVGRANFTFVELALKLELFERSEVAFMEDRNYSRMLEYLKDQFEFNQKFVGVDFYLRLMETYTNFVGADLTRRYNFLAKWLVVICGGLVYCFSPLIISLYKSEVNYQAPSSSSEVNGTTQTTKRKNLCTLRTSVPVRAYCLSHRIDLMGLMSENQANLILHTSGIGNYIILKFGDLADSPTPPLPPQDSYMVVFPYGSTVMFNMLDHEVGAYLEIIKRHALGMLPEKTKDHGDSTQKYIDCEVREKLYLPTSVQGGLNHMMFQNLSIDGISAIASVLGQSVALDYYSRLVDRRISEYTNINAGLEESGTLCSSKKFLKLVQRTYVDAGIVYGFGISARSDVTWKEDTECSHIFDYLRDKLKLTQRFADLDRKLKMRELHVWFAIVEIGLPKATANLSAYIIGSALMH